MRFDRLGEMHLVSCHHCPGPVLGACKSGKGNRRYFATDACGKLPYLANKLISILARHADVADHHIRAAGLQHLQSFRGVCSGNDLRFATCQHFPDKFAGILLVIDDKNPDSLEREIHPAGMQERACLLARVVNGCMGKAHDEGCALSFSRAFRADCASMQSHELLDDGEPQAEPAVLPGKRRIRLAKTIKNMREELGLNADPRVFLC